MVAIEQIFGVSLINRERLMRAREHYSPTTVPPSAEASFARWTQRVSVQSELQSAREISGLTDEELSAMEAEFVRCPVRPAAPIRRALPTGLALSALGAASLAMLMLSGAPASGAQQALQVLCAVVLAAGLAIVGFGFLSAFATLHLELCHGTTGLYFGRLDEQHPWLFKTMNLTHHSTAEAYRQRVLRERGWLRGVDYIMMKEIVRAQEAAEQTLATRAVAEKLQLLPAPVEAPAAQKPRLVTSRGERAKSAADARVKQFANGVK